MNEKSLQTISAEVASALRKKKQTLAVAESCTGGLLSAYFTANSGVSDVFLGGAVTYANSAKEHWLGVQKSTLISVGAVSQQVALEMARGVRRELQSDWGISITGIAGPQGGSAQKPVGTVFIACVGTNLETGSHHVFDGDRQAIRLASAYQALQLLLQQMSATIG